MGIAGRSDLGWCGDCDPGDFENALVGSRAGAWWPAGSS